MNYVQIYIYFQLFTSISTFLYPCQYLDLTKRIIKCNACDCLSSPAVHSTANLCSLTTSLNCINNSNENLLRTKLNNINIQLENQIELHNFNNDLLNHEQLCLIKNTSQITFFNLIYSLEQIPKCLSSISSLRFVNSFIGNKNFLSEILIFYNTTFNIDTLNLNLTKNLILHSTKFLIKPFELKSLSLLTHLTITYTEDYHLTGSFPHLLYLNLHSTKLNDQQLNKIFSQISIPDLTTLILSNNHLTTITNKFPSTIRYLDLSNNHIKSLDYYSFKSLYSLNMLNLSYNSPLEIQQDTFARIPYLEILDLTHTLPTLPFDELFLPLQKLQILNISSNSLDILPHLPIPHDAHIIESYDHHLPVLYIDLSNNNFEKLDFEIFSTPSTQDKYILSLNMNNNHLKTLNFSSILFNDTKRRGPFIELDLMNNPLECDCNLYESLSNLNKNDKQIGFKSNRFQTLPIKQSRLKLLHLSNLTCIDMIDPLNRYFLFDLNSSNSFCSYKNFCPSTCSCCSSLNTCNCSVQCPNECSCKHSSDLTNNYVNCSKRQLNKIPSNIPYSTTHLYLNHNQIDFINNNLTYLKYLKYLSLANNYLKYLSNIEFFMTNNIQILDLSSNHIHNIEPYRFSNMINLKKLYLHNNPWIPKFYNGNIEFISNIRLMLLTYANGLSCNRSTISSSLLIERPLTIEDCCKYSTIKSCQQILNIDSSGNSKKSFISIDYLKYTLIIFFLILFLIISIITIYIYRKKRLLFSTEKFLSNNDIKKQTNHYRTKTFNSHHPIYNHQENDNSISYTDEDDYASIPLTISQTDIPSTLRSQPNVPPLPPLRQFICNRPVSHSSTVSTTITIQSTKSPNSSSLTTTRSCLQIKLDVLVLYSINDSQYIHENIGRKLETMYGKRFSFYFIHRDRMLGELDWLIENSCITILILRKPYNLIHDYMKIISSCSAIKCFIILINNDQNCRTTSIKVREKIARTYRTSDIYEWNSNSNSLIHEQLELFLEQNCGSATYVTD